MTTLLDPPPERGLPETRRREIRAELARAARPPRRHPRRWALAVPPAVLVVVLGLVLARPWSADVGVPVSPPTTTAGTPTGAAPPPVPIPAATPTDRGPLDASTRQQSVRRCGTDTDADTSVDEVLFARRTTIDGDVVVFTDRSGKTSLCTDSALARISSASSDRQPLPRASSSHPVLQLVPPSPLLTTGTRHDTISTGTVYSVGPEVASLQMRLVVRGHAGTWFEASRSGDFAWSGARAHGTVPGSRIDQDVQIEDRAFDADGRELTISRQ